MLSVFAFVEQRLESGELVLLFDLTQDLALDIAGKSWALHSLIRIATRHHLIEELKELDLCLSESWRFFFPGIVNALDRTAASRESKGLADPGSNASAPRHALFFLLEKADPLTECGGCHCGSPVIVRIVGHGRNVAADRGRLLVHR